MCNASIGYTQFDTLNTVLKPRIGGGVGVLAYYGEIQNYQVGLSPLVNKVAASIFLNAPLSNGFNVEFTAMFGKVGANERGLNRNFNFESRIRSGSMIITYNFYHLLKNNSRNFTPFIGAGITSFEFLSKTDLFDKNGNKYNYWNDGSIMSLSQDDPLAMTAKPLYRDYIYETDLREQNFDSLGKYKEQSFAIPISIGGEWHVTSRVDFRLSTTLNYTFTDLIDNISPAGKGLRKGDDKKDYFMYSSFSLSYDLEFGNKEGLIVDNNELLDDNWSEFSQSDLDHDGVIDAFDDCPKTPLEAKVDKHGCPIDTDKDGVADYFDEEPNTPEGNFVNQYGVSLTDEDFRKQVLLFNDSTGEYHEWNEDYVRSSPKGDVSKMTYAKNTFESVPKSYVVIIGKEEKSVSKEELHKYLGYNEFKTIEKNDTTYYVMGEYEIIEDAVAAKTSLESNGIDVGIIGKTNHDATTFTEIEDEIIKKIEKVNIETGKELPTFDKPDQVYRVQVGAFKNKIDANKLFPNISSLVFATAEDGLTRYYTGVFDDHEDANAYKNTLRKNGYNKAFVVAYQDHERVTLKEAGVKLPKGYNEQNELESFVEKRTNNSNNSNKTQNLNIDMSKVKYRVLLGEFDSDIPVEIIDIYMAIGGVRPFKEVDKTSYYSRSVNTEEDAGNLIEDYSTYGLRELKLVYEYKGKYFSKEEFLNLKD